jgi:hypothetical protein
MFLLPFFVGLYHSPHGFGTERGAFVHTIRSWMIRRRDNIIKSGRSPTVAALLQGTNDAKLRSMCNKLGISSKDLNKIAEGVLEKSLFGGYEWQTVK